MTNNIDVVKAAQTLLDADNILILCHKNPDGDTVGSAVALMLALKKLDKLAAVLCHDKIPTRYDFLKNELFKKQFVPNFVVAVDVASTQLFGDNTLPYSECVDLCIDHHPSNSGYAKQVCCYGQLPATAQLMYDVIKQMEVAIDVDIANCLYTGLITDTGCFKYSQTTAQTHIVAARLLESGANHAMITDRFFMSKSKKNIELEKHALATLEFFYHDRCAVISLTNDVLDAIKPDPTDIDGISSIARAIEGVDVGVTIRQIGHNEFKISVRTTDNADACEIAAGLGGGGHTRAAGCEIVCSLECAKKAILREVEKALCR